MAPTVEVRTATSADAEVLHGFIVDLAVYEREPDAVEIDVTELRRQMEADHPPFEALLAEIDGVPVGLALYFTNYSTWKGVAGIHLEDLFVPEQHRGAGIGTALLSELARITVARGGARLEWQVLDWNEPSIRYYESIGATVMRDWLPCRLDGTALQHMAAQQRPFSGS